MKWPFWWYTSSVYGNFADRMQKRLRLYATAPRSVSWDWSEWSSSGGWYGDWYGAASWWSSEDWWHSWQAPWTVREYGSSGSSSAAALTVYSEGVSTGRPGMPDMPGMPDTSGILSQLTDQGGSGGYVVYILPSSRPEVAQLALKDCGV